MLLWSIHHRVRDDSKYSKTTLTHTAAPTAFSNGPTILEAQGDFITDVISRAEREGLRTVEADKTAQDEWRDLIEKMCETLLVRFTNSWWNGGNIYGKKTQMLTFPAGINVYEQMCRQKLEKWDGFVVEKHKEESAEAINADKNMQSQVPVLVAQ